MVDLKVNGKTHAVDAEPDTPLLYVLRDDLKLNGAKYGCGLGQCGSCTVMVDGEAAFSCLVPVVLVEGHEITTLEGLGSQCLGCGDPHPAPAQPLPLQRAYADHACCEAGGGGHEGSVNAVAFGEIDGAPVIVSRGDRATRLWDACSGTLLHRRDTRAHSCSAVAVSVVDDAPVIVSPEGDGTVHLWDPHSGTLLRRLDGHAYGGVCAIAVGVIDGAPVIVSGDADGTVRLWDPRSGVQLRLLRVHKRGVKAVAVGVIGGSPVIVSGHDDGTLHLWDAHAGVRLMTVDLEQRIEAIDIFGTGGVAIGTDRGLLCLELGAQIVDAFRGRQSGR